MARYLAVVPVQAEGRPVLPAPGEASASLGSWTHLPAVPAGDRLVAVVNNGEWQAALDVTHPDAFARLSRRCRDGIWREMRLYLLGEERAVQLEDGRRVLMNGEPVKDPGPTRRNHGSS